MRNLKGFIGICILAMIGNTASAQIKIVIDNQVIPTEHIESIFILPNSNTISIITTIPYTVEPSDAEPPPPGAVAINSFSATPSSFTEGGATTLSWTTTNANSCDATGGTGGWSGSNINLPNGSSQPITINTSDSYVFTLTCRGEAGDTVVKNRTVTVNEVVTHGNCPDSPLSGSSVSWLSLWGVAFPGPGYGNEIITVPRFGYKAVEFNSSSVFDNGAFLSIETTNTTGRRLGSISQCEGDFDVPDDCKFTWGQEGGIGWSTNPIHNGMGLCMLESETTYYFNITFTDGFNDSSSECGGVPCQTKLRHINN